MTHEPLPPPVPGDPWYRRSWAYTNRPYSGCGCVWALLLFVMLWWLLAMLIPSLAVWSGWF